LIRFPLFRWIITSAIQRIAWVSEAQLPHYLNAWHSYEISWEEFSARLYMDKVEVPKTDHPPNGPLVFLAWIDNQYALASPQGEMRFGIVPAKSPQTLELLDLQLHTS
jgi:hypothetical protein